VADVDITALVAFHRGHGHTGTVTAVQPAGRFGSLGLGEELWASGQAPWKVW
jgi:glucose-1-phosphate cytidylyltransferase